MKVKVKADRSLKLDLKKKKINKSILHNINTFRKQLFTFSWTTKNGSDPHFFHHPYNY